MKAIMAIHMYYQIAIRFDMWFAMGKVFSHCLQVSF